LAPCRAAIKTIDDHAIVGLDPVLDHAQIADKLAESRILPRHVSVSRISRIYAPVRPIAHRGQQA